MTRSQLRLPGDLERALHGTHATRAASDPLRAPETWELVVAAVHLALLGEHRDAPPANLAPELARLLAASRTRTP